MFEPVHTMTDYYDGPRRGIADYRGRQYLYESRWSDIDTHEDDTFLLMQIDAETFRLAREDWAIWRRWEVAFHEGRASQETHPALPEDRARHEELDELLRDRLVMRPETAFCARAQFRVRLQAEYEPGWRPLEVEWRAIPCDESTANDEIRAQMDWPPN